MSVNGFKEIKRQKGVALEDTFTNKGKKDKNDYKSFTFWMEKETHSAFKSYCAKNNLSMAEVVKKYIETLI